MPPGKIKTKGLRGFLMAALRRLIKSLAMIDNRHRRATRNLIFGIRRKHKAKSDNAIHPWLNTETKYDHKQA